MRKLFYGVLSCMTILSFFACGDDSEESEPQKLPGDNEPQEVLGDTNGYEYVDLDLPSGNLWATMNMGASAIQEFGDVYSWGETELKDSWSNFTYKLYQMEETGEGENTTTIQGHTKYVPKDQAEKYGFKGFYDDKVTLELEDDAAHVVMGGSWRIPKDSDWKELRQNCEAQWCIYEDVHGYKFTGKNGAWIFLPAAGVGDWSKRRYEEQYGYYWSSSVVADEPSAGKCLTFNSSACFIYGNFRYDGSSIRAICPTKK